MQQIEGNRLRLHDWQLADLESYATWQQPGHRWQQLDGPYYPRTKPEEIPEQIAKIRGWIEKNAWPTPRRRLNICDKNTDQLLGQVSWYWQSQETNWLSVGIVIYDPAFWGQGLGFEALGLWCDYLWHAMPDLARLDLRTWSGNVGMMRLAEKLGFKEEARFRDARIVNGEFFDSMGYGMLRSEWQQRYPEGFGRYLHQQQAKSTFKKVQPHEKTAVYTQQITQAEPNLQIETAQLNEEGLVNDVMIVNGRHVFRFPKHEWAVDHLRQEANCLNLAQQHLTLPLPSWKMYDGKLLGFPFVSYDWIPGEALSRHLLLRLPLTDQQAIAAQLGTFLHQLHTIPMPEVERAGIRPSVTNRTPQKWQTLYEDVEEMLFLHMMPFARDWVEHHFAPVLTHPDFMAHDPVFMNGDLGGYHLLYNPNTQRLNGIIDFGTAGIGDPATDFACLLDQFGEQFVRLMNPYYPNIAAHIERARFWAGTLELQWLLGGLRYPDEPNWFMVHIGHAATFCPLAAVGNQIAQNGGNMTFMIRPFTQTDKDYEAIYAVEKAVFPKNATTIAEFKHADATRPAEQFFQAWVVAQDGRIIAFGNSKYHIYATTPGRYRFNITVHPDFEGRGVGTAVYNQIWQTLQTCTPAPVILESSCYQHHPQAVRFLQQRGFRQTMRWVISKLDLPAADTAQFAPLIQKLEAEGITFHTVPNLQISDPAWMNKLHELDWQLVQDEPLPYTPKKISLAEFKKMYLDAPTAMVDSWMVAVKNGRYIGNSLLEKGSQPGVVSTGFTGVLRGYRRRGLATALKAKTIEYAKKAGFQRIRTGNEENNSMLTLNKKLGFEELTASLAFEKQLEERKVIE
ncbi:GNAT family N-acetyltransferase [Candidatus Leptofilum sp.]|uniref:GNAT family N-acetyltransferase n=1 Tax=Candidatus Leptofilum sp. TaxID=3241576 RepID=UPI003B59B0E4